MCRVWGTVYNELCIAYGALCIVYRVQYLSIFYTVDYTCMYTLYSMVCTVCGTVNSVYSLVFIV